MAPMAWVDTFMWWFIGVVAWWCQFIGITALLIIIPLIVREYTKEEATE